jgi:gliding motility-associated-like protein
MVDICPVNLPVEIEAQGEYEKWTDMIWHDNLYRGQRRRIASLSDTVNVIRVVNADNCWSTASQSVLLAPPTYYEAGADLAECEPKDGVPFSTELNAGEFVIYFDSTSDDPIEVPITGYRWFNMETGDQVGDQQILMATAAGSYMVEVSDGCWLNTDTFNIELFPNPVIAYLDSTLFRQIVVFAENGTAPLQYALNNNAPQSDNVFKNLPNGNYTVYVIDANGCEDSEAFLLETTLNLEVPNFFTPNNDGFNDRWEIIGIEKLPESIIYIYDRYGKLLRKYKASDPAWDGEYLNRPLPSDDYWYVIHLLPIDKYLKGNVTLKR